MHTGIIRAGDYKGKGVAFKGTTLLIPLKVVWTIKDGENCIVINKQNVASYTLVDKTLDNKQYTVELNWQDGKRSLLECDKYIYDEIMKIMF